MVRINTTDGNEVLVITHAQIGRAEHLENGVVGADDVVHTAASARNDEFLIGEATVEGCGSESGADETGEGSCKGGEKGGPHPLLI